MQRKIGDKVRIKKDLQVNKYYNEECMFNDKMEQYKGKTAVVKSVSYYGEHSESNRCRLDIDNERWAWSDDMLEPAPKTLDNLEEGDILIDKDDDESMVLGVHSKMVHLSEENSFEERNNCDYTIAELKDNGYKLKEDKEDDKKEKLLNKAQELIDKAEELKKEANNL